MDDPSVGRPVSRRACVQALASGFVVTTSALLNGCRGDEGLTCVDTTALSATERVTRDSLKYVDRTAQRERRCTLCVQYEPPQKDASCGGCKLMKGPVHPSGSCLAWAARG